MELAAIVFKHFLKKSSEIRVVPLSLKPGSCTEYRQGCVYQAMQNYQHTVYIAVAASSIF